MNHPHLPSTTPQLADAMALAVKVSERAQGASSPNPAVGAVLTNSDGAVIAVGATEAPGGRHAEIVALDAAGPAARGATMVVTLEPCNHHGRTGPCTQRLIEAGVEKVVIGCADPNPLAAGGAHTLSDAGVTVYWHEPHHTVAHGPLRPWLHRQHTGRPLVTWKYAASLDGRVAAADGTSQWITSAESRTHAHRTRQHVDAIIVGTGTAAADNPSLTARRPDGSLYDHQPLACVMGLSEIPDSAAVRQSPGGFIHLATRDPHEALAQLNSSLHVLVEGGPTVAGAFLAAGVVDDIDAYLAPLVLGQGSAAVSGAGVNTLAAAHQYTITHTTPLGPDLYLHLRQQKG